MVKFRLESDGELVAIREVGEDCHLSALIEVLLKS